jgi:hypothetical protein
MPPANTGQFANHLAPGISGILGTRLKSRKTYYSEYYDMEPTENRNYLDYLAAAGLPIAPRKLEGDAITSIDPLEGSTKRVSFEEWGIGFEVTQTAWEDDLYASSGSALRDASTGLADSLAERVEVEAHRPLNTEGFDTTFTVLPDTSGFIATSHAAITGGEAAAQSNRSATDAELSVTSWRIGRIQFMKYVNDRGLRIPDYAMPAKLIVPVDLEDTANEVIGSSNRPDTANKVENVTRGMVQVRSTPYITDTNLWILQAQRHFLKFFWRSRPRFDNFDDRRRRVAIFVAWQRFRALPLHWLGHYGSNPA